MLSEEEIGTMVASGENSENKGKAEVRQSWGGGTNMDVG